MDTLFQTDYEIRNAIAGGQGDNWHSVVLATTVNCSDNETTPIDDVTP
jgi:hypothetical protein